MASPPRQSLANKGPEQQRIAVLEQKLQRRNEILAELMDEHLALKQAWEAVETDHDNIGSVDPDA